MIAAPNIDSPKVTGPPISNDGLTGAGSILKVSAP